MNLFKLQIKQSQIIDWRSSSYYIHILPGVGLSITHFFLRFVGLDFDLPLLDCFEELGAEVWCVKLKSPIDTQF